MAVEVTQGGKITKRKSKKHRWKNARTTWTWICIFKNLVHQNRLLHAKQWTFISSSSKIPLESQTGKFRGTETFKVHCQWNCYTWKPHQTLLKTEYWVYKIPAQVLRFWAVAQNRLLGVTKVRRHWSVGGRGSQCFSWVFPKLFREKSSLPGPGYSGSSAPWATPTSSDKRAKLAWKRGHTAAKKIQEQ